MKIRFVLLCMILAICTSTVYAQKFQEAGDSWITKWWGMDLVRNQGGFAASAGRDFIDEGTKSKVTDATASTPEGLKRLFDLKTVNLDKQHGDKKNNGELEWKVVTIVPNDGMNMSSSHGEVDLSNIEWYGIIVIASPTDRTTTMHPAHDDHAHIWLNGEKVYDNPTWTGGATTVTRPTKVTLKKGENILLFRCGESGGSDYINLHFEKADNDLKILPTTNDEFEKHIKSLSVEPGGKLTTTWADIKVN